MLPALFRHNLLSYYLNFSLYVHISVNLILEVVLLKKSLDLENRVEGAGVFLLFSPISLSQLILVCIGLVKGDL